ncbi:MAG TPA: phospholipase D-like domain-containing protein [Bdellovibrionota bacterium]|nr:phospholipase D-like domain-containing protein [Bdellovibrionota bacterium]
MQRWHEESLFTHGDEFYVSLIADIASAREQIDMEMYIYRLDGLGRRVSEALIGAARRGVRVRLLVDAIGSAFELEGLEAFFAETGVQLRFYRRFIVGGVLTPLANLNRRNHRKTALIDRRWAYVSSANVSSVHLSRAAGGESWKDVSARVSGEGVLALEAAFEVAWTKPSWRPGLGRRHKRREFEAREGHADDLVHLNDTRSRRRSLRLENKLRILQARERVWIANPYFAPHHSELRALKNAARRGLDVRVLLPKVSDVFFMPFVTFAYYKTLLRAGVKVYRYLPSVLHEKLRIIDDHHMIGSSNFDFRSLLYNLECDVMVTHPENQQKLERDFESSLLHAEALTVGEIERTSIFTKILATIFSLFKYWV